MKRRVKKFNARSKAKSLYDSMMLRANHAKGYVNVKVCKEWEDFENFYEWFKDQVEKKWYRKGRHLDKDLLSPKDCKIYSPETCCFLPAKVNLFLVNSSKKGRKLPPAVIYNSLTELYCAHFSVDGYVISSGDYTTAYDAFLYYKNYKEKMAKEIAEVLKDKVDPRAYEAMLKYTIVWEDEDTYLEAIEDLDYV